MRNLYMSIPRKWRSRIALWVAAFLVGQFVIWIWGLETLLTILIFLIFVAALFRTFGLTRAVKMERWSIEQFLGRIRGMVIFAFLPAAWELIRNPSISSIISLLLLLLCGLIIWDSFGKIIKSWGRTSLSTRRRRRR